MGNRSREIKFRSYLKIVAYVQGPYTKLGLAGLPVTGSPDKKGSVPTFNRPTGSTGNLLVIVSISFQV